MLEINDAIVKTRHDGLPISFSFDVCSLPRLVIRRHYNPSHLSFWWLLNQRTISQDLQWYIAQMIYTWSLKVVADHTVRRTTYDFLLVFR